MTVSISAPSPLTACRRGLRQCCGSHSVTDPAARKSGCCAGSPTSNLLTLRLASARMLISRSHMLRPRRASALYCWCRCGKRANWLVTSLLSAEKSSRFPTSRSRLPADPQGEEMPESGTSTFIDPDDYQASLDRVPLDLMLVTSRGEFKACVTS